jgi:hypothetical protein
VAVINLRSRLEKLEAASSDGLVVIPRPSSETNEQSGGAVDH